jgi:hypothetical protein
MPSGVSGVLNRLRRAPRRLVKELSDGQELANLRRALAEVRPGQPRATVVVTALSPGGIDGPGKVDAAAFFPRFAACLARAGVATEIVTSLAELPAALTRTGGPAVLVHVYREVAHRIDRPEVIEAERQAAAVFNRAESGPIVADKLLTNELLTGCGVRMPSLTSVGPVFSNHRQDSRAEVLVVQRISEADPSRYNTAFVDTRVAYGGRTYHTCVRLICVGGRIVHGYVRARDDAEGSPSVHAADTPLDVGLIEMLQERQVRSRMAELAAIATRVAAALGPGFYSHDVLVPADGGAALLCETGFKFTDGAYTRRLLPIAAELASHRMMFVNEQWAERSAGVFLDECAALGYL